MKVGIFKFSESLVCDSGHPSIQAALSPDNKCPLCDALDKIACLEFHVACLEEKVQILEERP